MSAPANARTLRWSSRAAKALGHQVGDHLHRLGQLNQRRRPEIRRLKGHHAALAKIGQPLGGQRLGSRPDRPWHHLHHAQIGGLRTEGLGDDGVERVGEDDRLLRGEVAEEGALGDLGRLQICSTVVAA